MRHLLTCAAALVGCLLLLVAGRSSLAQQDMFYFTQQIETAFANVETSRLASDCPIWRKRLGELRTYLAPLTGPNATAFNAPVREEYRTRLAEAAARPCPPQVAQPSPPAAAPVTPAPAPVLAPLPRTVTLEDLRLQLAEACGAAFDPARERFIAALDRAIRFESNPRQRRYLELDRAAVQRLKVPKCPSAEAAASPAATTRFFAMQRFYNNANLLSDRLQKAETARYAGDCARRASELDAAWAALAAMQASGYTPTTPRYDEALLREQEGKPCPDPASKAAPQPAPPPRISTPPPAPTPAPATTTVRACAPSYQAQRASGNGLTCRCAGQQQYLSIWGANPYRKDSAICNAAIHAGALPQSGIGVVRLVPVPLARAALGTVRNGISASNWDYAFEDGFSVGSGGSDTAQPGQPAREPDGRYMFGTFDTTYGPMFLVNGRGSYTDSNGTITPTKIDGTILEAEWVQSSSSRRCADGRYRGRLRFVFTETGFVGTWAYCDDPLGGSWSGTRREAAQ